MATPTKPDLAEQRRQLPDQPGVYLFRDVEGRVIYVGKAKSIRKRVASHFGSGRGAAYAGHTDLPAQIESIETVVTTTEAEAFLAEQEFIHRYRPRFNIRLRDDKSYPYIGISLDEAFPRVYFTRERHRRDRAYFGPYSNAKKTRETLDLLGKIFLFRSCNGAEPGRRSGSPCLDYYIKRCEAPCVGYVDEERYGEAIDGVVDFLSGRYRHIERDLEQRMRAAADGQLFEQAALERNRLHAVRALLERQRVARESVGTLDAIAVAMEGPDANAQVFQVRDGVLSDRQSFYLANEAGRGLDEVVEEFVLQYYATAMSLPPQVIVQRGVQVTDALAEALSARREARVEVRSAERGDKRRIVELAERNARLALDQERLRDERRRQSRVEALDGLQEALGLDTIPLRIEGFDISNLGGTQTVASMVVFEGGAPKKSDYRRFRIRSLAEGVPDDYAAMEEVLSRRMASYERQADLSPHDPAYNASFAALPNVILIDGGRGQLAAGLKALPAFRERGVTIISLAKRIEEVFLPGRAAPLVMRHDTPELQLLQRVRDEAHRFAIEHHRSRRDRAMTGSIFDGLPGIGPTRKRALLKHFGSPEAVLSASREELEAVPGVPGKVARDLYAQLHRTGG
jgi:excinuclease ABC subunit C